METEDLNKIILAIHARSAIIVETIDKNTSKLQEILDELREHRSTADAEFKENLLVWLQRLHQQGQP
ncbi:hypothetical protein LCGC14_0491340 [marine sediment metagenome]|uniref:Uncharacterized protein n=1 Tax=marine sediment metagenome TaxID=412755 RepID=A0A0F9UTD7_9ZZZZ